MGLFSKHECGHCKVMVRLACHQGDAGGDPEDCDLYLARLAGIREGRKAVGGGMTMAIQSAEEFLAGLVGLTVMEQRARITARDAEIRAEGLSSGVAAIAAERRRQIDVEGWTPEHDDQHVLGELAGAAACYAYGEMIRADTGVGLWAWDEEWWKPDDRRRELEKAGALIAAEIDRLDRAAHPAERAVSVLEAATGPERTFDPATANRAMRPIKRRKP